MVADQRIVMISIVMLISVGAAELVTGHIGGSFLAVAGHDIDYTSNATISFFVTWLGDVLLVIRESLNPMLVVTVLPFYCY